MSGLNLGPQGFEEEDDAEQEQAGTMSLMSGVAQSQGVSDADVLGIDDDSERSKLPQSTLLILAVVVIAGGALMLMRMSHGDLQSERLTADVRAKIDQAVAKFSNQHAMSPNDPMRPENIDELFRDTESVVAMFATDFTENQVPVQYVKKNPFVLDRPKSEKKEKTDDGELERRYQQWLTERRREIQKLHLEAVMGGATPVAIVDGESVTVGQKLGSFKVAAIEGQTMRLETVFRPTGKRVVVKLKMPG